VPAATVVIVRAVPWWGTVSSAAAPVLMAGGWTVAAGLQQSSYNQVADTVSALAAPGAADRWVMTLTFLLVGACDVVTGLALRPARAAGRVILIAGAVAGMLVAASPEHPGIRFPVPHMIWAAAGCAALVAWPAGAWRRGTSVPWGLRPAVSAGAVAVLVALLALVRRGHGPRLRSACAADPCSSPPPTKSDHGHVPQPGRMRLPMSASLPPGTLYIRTQVREIYS
jgi:hypothetical protein